MGWRTPEFLPINIARESSRLPHVQEPVYRVEMPSPKPKDVNEPFVRRAVWGFEAGYGVDRDSQVAEAFGEGESYALERLSAQQAAELPKRIKKMGHAVIECSNGLRYVNLYERRGRAS